MILMDAGFKEVKAIVVAKRKATVADRVMHLPRKQDHSGSIPDGSSTVEERE
jgi:hypothetical protein